MSSSLLPKREKFLFVNVRDVVVNEELQDEHVAIFLLLRLFLLSHEAVLCVGFIDEHQNGRVAVVLSTSKRFTLEKNTLFIDDA